VSTPYKHLKNFEEWIKEREIKNSELIWNEVEGVEETELERVIDITCKNFHSFVANGFISHNCNYSSKIIEPIQSRCAVFRFKALAEADVRKYIQRIVEGEKLKITEDGIKAIIEISEGDLRKVANLLQASSALGEKITEDVVYEVASQAKPTDVKEMLELALKGKFEDARKKLQDMLLKQGLAGRDVIREIHKQIYSLPLTEEAKVQLVEKCGEYEFRISEGGDDLIQLEAFLAQFLLFSKK
jgi:replication factor C small subunit